MTSIFDPNCRQCPRLAAFLDEVLEKHPDYHCRPVPPFGDDAARLLIVGLAPGMHGANRSGRPFTGDYAGVLLYDTLHQFGFSSAGESVSADDGLRLPGARITNAVKCLPPDNKPVGAEVNASDGIRDTDDAPDRPGQEALVGSEASRDQQPVEVKTPQQSSRPLTGSGETTATQDVRSRSAGAVRGDAINDITFDDLKIDLPAGQLFDRSLLTPRIKELDGQEIRIRGFIFAGGVFQQSGIKSFPFVMNTQCKFGPRGLAYCVILVELDEGVTTDFTTYPITVEGTLAVRPFNDGGFTWSVYHMQGHKVY